MIIEGSFDSALFFYNRMSSLIKIYQHYIFKLFHNILNHILDLVLIMNNILGANTLSQIEFYASDMNEDAIINIQDIIIIN